MHEKPRRVRRSSKEVNELILSAARTLFAERGYRASTRDIAKLAGVAEALIFRQFGSKARLFESVLSEPLIQFYETFDRNNKPGSNDPDVLAYRGDALTEELFDLMSQNRRLLLAYVSALEFEPEMQATENRLQDYFRIAVEKLNRRYEALGLEPSIPLNAMVRLSFGTVVGIVLFQNWIFDGRDYKDMGFPKDLHRFLLPDFPRERDSAAAQSHRRKG